MYDRINDSSLPEIANTGEEKYTYQIIITEAEAAVYLVPVDGIVLGRDLKEFIYTNNRGIRLLSVNVDNIKAEDYAKVYETNKVAIRQNIRRGSLRTVYKMSAFNRIASWYVSKLSEVKKRTYKKSNIYHIDGNLFEVNEDGFTDLFKVCCNYVEIKFVTEDEYKIELYMKLDDKPIFSTTYDKNSKERLELFLLCQKDVYPYEKGNPYDGILIKKII